MNDISFKTVLSQRRSQRECSNDAIPQDSLEPLIWAFPSAHGLHPLRLYVTVARVDGLKNGFYAVDPDTSEFTMMHDRDIRADLQEAAVDDQTWIGKSAAILSICADFCTPCRNFADQPPLGPRGWRYVYIEAGAAAQNVQLQAVSESIGSVLVAGFNDEPTAAVLGLTVPVAPVLHVCLGLPLSLSSASINEE